MFEANQFKRTEELLQSILVELRSLTAMMESLPKRLREAVEGTNAEKPQPPEGSSNNDFSPPNPASPSNPGPERSDPPQKNPDAFDLDAFLKDKLKTWDS
jgi:hypothetical protein